MPQRDAVTYEVYVDTIPREDFQYIQGSESSGAARLDTATFEVILEHLEDFDPLAWLNLEVEVLRGTEVIHWGKVTKVPIIINRGGETLQITSRTELYHLGGKVDGYYVWDPDVADVVKIDGDLVFNPLIDGLIYGNRNDTKTTPAGHPLILDPESVRTTASQTLQGANIANFTLAQTVEYLIWSLNDETYVDNVSAVNLAIVFNDPNVLVRDVRIARGTYLAQALDQLLTPLGYQWRVSKTAAGVRTYAFWKRGGGGTLRTVKHQVWGSTLNLTNQNVETAGITFDVSSLGNEVIVRGGFGEYEMTVELLRCWAEEDDPTSGMNDELSKEHPAFVGKENVLRKWVLNEAGDYIDLRPEIDGLYTSGLRTLLSAASIEDQFVARRRKLMPTLTLDDDLTPIGKTSPGIEVEFSNVSGTADWRPIDELSGAACTVLESEAGLYFGGTRLPEEFLTDPDNLRIRATFTLQNDYRLLGYAARLGNSPNDDVVPVVVSAPDRFRYRLLTTWSKHAGSGKPSLVINDTTTIQDFAEYARDTWDAMKSGGAIQLEGLDHTYFVGDRVQKIEGKEISFEAHEATGIYPQIVAIERNFQQQVTTLHLEHFTEPLTLPFGRRGTSQRFAPGSFRGRTI
jgi:hypothetical protein